MTIVEQFQKIANATHDLRALVNGTYRKPKQPIAKREACDVHGRDADQLTDNCSACGTTPESGL
ncbi:MAG: hypothetical protein Q8R36_03790 [bacterium]|nr:hypothetical protein [bacterium]